jgi:hypothetical protein
MRPKATLLAALLWIALAACTPEDANHTSDGVEPEEVAAADDPYAGPARWLCGPDARPDPCAEADLSAASIRPDTTMEVREHLVGEDPGVDCFYVYPTVHFEKECGNARLGDVSSELFATIHQAARFTSTCRVFAPLYRQAVRCAELGRGGEVSRRAIADVAYADVRDAFEHYWTRHNRGRPFVLLGHSQGADLLARLLAEDVAPSPAVRKRLAVALLAGGNVFVAPGADQVGDVPLCRSDEQTGCIVAYRTYAASHPPIVDPDAPAPEADIACTNPASLEGGAAPLRASYFPRAKAWSHPVFKISALATKPQPDVAAPHLVYEEQWIAECLEDDHGQSYLAFSLAPGREDWIDYDSAFLNPAAYGTHVLDVQLALGDLIRLVEVKGAALGGS